MGDLPMPARSRALPSPRRLMAVGVIRRTPRGSYSLTVTAAGVSGRIEKAAGR